MKKNHYAWRLALMTITILVAVAAIGFVAWQYLKTQNIPVLQPKGSVGQTELDLLIFTGILSLIVIIPVFSIAIFIAFRYHEQNTKAKYSPNWDSNKTIETIWWGIPIILILIIATVTWISTHKLDPYKPFDKKDNALVIQVVALDWKWLFLYPNQNIATVNFVQFPVDRPVDFEITADAPMNSFWIPQLGGQMYAMAGMTTHQHLISNTIGDYAGSSANISGPGFADMKFTARVSSANDFTKWVDAAKRQTPNILTAASYSELAKPSKKNPVATYSAVEYDVVSELMTKYMGENHDMTKTHNMEMN